MWSVKKLFFRLNMATIMVATITSYVNTTVIMTMAMIHDKN